MSRGRTGRKGSSCCLKIIITSLISLVVMIGGVVLAANILFNKFVSPRLGDITLSETWGVIRSFKKNASEEENVTNPYEKASYVEATEYSEGEVYYTHKPAGYYPLEASEAFDESLEYYEKDGDAFVKAEITAFEAETTYYVYEKEAYVKSATVSSTNFSMGTYYTYDSGDLGDFFANIKRVLLLSENSDLSLDSLITLLSSSFGNATEEDADAPLATSDEETGEEAGSTSDIMKLLEELNVSFDLTQLEGYDHTDYTAPANLDYTRLPLIDKQLAALIGQLIPAVLDQFLGDSLSFLQNLNMGDVALTDYFELSQLIIDEYAREESLIGEERAVVEPSVTVTMRLGIRKLLNTAYDALTGVREDGTVSPLKQYEFVASLGFKVIKSFFRENLYLTATVFPQSNEAQMTFRINNSSEKVQQNAYKLINGVLNLTGVNLSSVGSDEEVEEENVTEPITIEAFLTTLNGKVVELFDKVEEIVPINFIASSSGVSADLYPLEILMSALKLEGVKTDDLLTSLKILGVVNNPAALDVLGIPKEAVLDFYGEIATKYGLTIAGYRVCASCSEYMIFDEVDGKYVDTECGECNVLNDYSRVKCSSCSNILEFDSDSDGVMADSVGCSSCETLNVFVEGFNISELINDNTEGASTATELLNNVMLTGVTFGSNDDMKVELSDKALAVILKDMLASGKVGGEESAELLEKLEIADLNINRYEGGSYFGIDITFRVADTQSLLGGEGSNLPTLVTDLLPSKLYLKAQVFLVDNGEDDGGLPEYKRWTAYLVSQDQELVSIDELCFNGYQDEYSRVALETVASLLKGLGSSDNSFDRTTLLNTVSNALLDALNTMSGSSGSFGAYLGLADGGIALPSLYELVAMQSADVTTDDVQSILQGVYNYEINQEALSSGFDDAALSTARDSFFDTLNDRFYIKTESKITYSDIFPETGADLGASDESTGLASKLNANSILFNPVTDEQSEDYGRNALYTDTTALEEMKVSLTNKAMASLIKTKLTDFGGTNDIIAGYELMSLNIKYLTYLKEEAEIVDYNAGYELQEGDITSWWMSINLLIKVNKSGDMGNILPDALLVSAYVDVDGEVATTLVFINGNDESWTEKLFDVVGSFVGGSGEATFDIATISSTIGDAVSTGLDTIKEYITIGFEENEIVFDSIYGILAGRSTDDTVTAEELYKLMREFGKSPTAEGEKALNAISNTFVEGDESSFINEVNTDYYLKQKITAEGVFSGDFLGGNLGTDSINFSGEGGVYKDERVILDKNDTNKEEHFSELSVELWDKALASLLLASGDGGSINVGGSNTGTIKEVSLVKREVDTNVYHTIMVCIIELEAASAENSIQPTRLYGVCELDLDDIQSEPVTEYTSEELDKGYVYEDSGVYYKYYYNCSFAINDMSSSDTERFFEVILSLADSNMSMESIIDIDAISVYVGALVYQQLSNIETQLKCELEFKVENEYVRFADYYGDSHAYIEGMKYFTKEGIEYKAVTNLTASAFDPSLYYIKSVGEDGYFMSVSDDEVVAGQTYYILDNGKYYRQYGLTEFANGQKYYTRKGLGYIVIPSIYAFLVGEGSSDPVRDKDGNPVSAYDLAWTLREFGREPENNNNVNGGEGGVVYLDNTIKGLSNSDLYYDLQTSYFLRTPVTSESLYSGTLFKDTDGSNKIGSEIMNLKGYATGDLGLFYTTKSAEDMSVTISDKQLGIMIMEEEGANRLSTSELKGELASIRIYYISIDGKPYIVTQFTLGIELSGYNVVDTVTSAFDNNEEYYAAVEFLPFEISNVDQFESGAIYYKLIDGAYKIRNSKNAFTSGTYYRHISDFSDISEFFTVNIKGFDSRETYYTYSGSSYVEVGSNAIFDDATTYYIKRGDRYYNVSKTSFDSDYSTYYIKSGSNLLPSKLYLTSQTLQRVDGSGRNFYSTELFINNMTLADTDNLFAYIDGLGARFGVQSLSSAFDLSEITDNISAMVEILMDSLSKISDKVSFVQYEGSTLATFTSSNDDYKIFTGSFNVDDKYYIKVGDAFIDVTQTGFAPATTYYTKVSGDNYSVVSNGTPFNFLEDYYVEIDGQYYLVTINSFDPSVTYYTDELTERIFNELTSNYSRYQNTNTKGSSYIVIPNAYEIVLEALNINDGIEEVDGYGYETLEQYSFFKGSYYVQENGNTYVKVGTYDPIRAHYVYNGSSYELKTTAEMRADGFTFAGQEGLDLYTRSEIDGVVSYTLAAIPYDDSGVTQYYVRTLYVTDQNLLETLVHLNGVEKLRETTAVADGMTVYYERQNVTKKELASLALISRAYYTEDNGAYTIAGQFGAAVSYYSRRFDTFIDSFGDTYILTNVKDFDSCYYYSDDGGTTKKVVDFETYNENYSYYLRTRVDDNPPTYNYTPITFDELAAEGLTLTNFYVRVEQADYAYYEVALTYSGEATYYSFVETATPSGVYAVIAPCYDMATNSIADQEVVPGYSLENQTSLTVSQTDKGFGYTLQNEFGKFAYGDESADASVLGMELLFNETSFLTSEYIQQNDEKIQNLRSNGFVLEDSHDYLLVIISLNFATSFGGGAVGGLAPTTLYYAYLYDFETEQTAGSMLNEMTGENIAVFNKLAKVNFLSSGDSFEIGYVNTTLETAFTAFFEDLQNTYAQQVVDGSYGMLTGYSNVRTFETLTGEDGLGKIIYEITFTTRN